MNTHQIKTCFSPSSVTFEIRFCLFRTWSFTRFTNDLDSTDNSNSCFIVSNDESLRPCPFVENRHRVSPGFGHEVWPHSQRDCAVPSCWVFLVRETRLNFSCRSPRSFIGSPRIARTSQSQLFSTLEKTKHGRHPTLTGRPDLSSFLANCTPEILTSVTSLPRAYWKSRTIRFTASWQ